MATFAVPKKTFNIFTFLALRILQQQWNESQYEISWLLAIGGSRGGVRDARPPWASKFFRFHAVFGKIWRVHAPPGGFTPPLGKILDPPLLASIILGEECGRPPIQPQLPSEALRIIGTLCFRSSLSSFF